MPDSDSQNRVWVIQNLSTGLSRTRSQFELWFRVPKYGFESSPREYWLYWYVSDGRCVLPDQLMDATDRRRRNRCGKFVWSRGFGRLECYFGCPKVIFFCRNTMFVFLFLGAYRYESLIRHKINRKTIFGMKDIFLACLVWCKNNFL